MPDQLKQAVATGLIRNIDFHFARHMDALAGRAEPNVALAAALVSARVGAGDVCLDLHTIAGNALHADSGELTVPALDNLLEALQRSPLVGAPGGEAPLILDDTGRLYLGRYWHYERQVADNLLARAVPVEMDATEQDRLAAVLQTLFPAGETGTDWQRVAAGVAALRRFAVISGGPGTGKTHTVTAILALLAGQAGTAGLEIALAAPTGKAAARLTESIRLAKPSINCDDGIRSRIPEEAATVHRLLGVRPGRLRPRYHAGNPLPIDVLIVDEASMIDLPLMARLLDALPAHARLIMLGDKDQLASVEAGSVFADISGERAGAGYSKGFVADLNACTGQSVAVESTAPGIADSVALLRKSYRFDDDAGIGALARAVNAGDGDAAMSLLRGGAAELGYRAIEQERIGAQLAAEVLAHYARGFEADSPRAAIQGFGAFRVLCAVRKGPAGVEQVNRVVERALAARGLIRGDGTWYQGRPVMVTRNDYGLGLFNGDIGILWPDPDADGALRAWFVMPDDSMKRVLPARLPEHETAFAMTVHKSQGSEFGKVLMLLPFEDNEVLTRELLYTGITRARESVEVWGPAGIVTRCIGKRVRRVSGLAEKLYPG